MLDAIIFADDIMMLFEFLILCGSLRMAARSSAEKL